MVCDVESEVTVRQESRFDGKRQMPVVADKGKDRALFPRGDKVARNLRALTLRDDTGELYALYAGVGGTQKFGKRQIDRIEIRIKALCLG